MAISSALAATAQTAATAEQSFLVDAWTSFIGYCGAFAKEPVAFRDALDLSAPDVEHARSDDGRVFDYIDNAPDRASRNGIVLEGYASRIDGHCTAEYEYDTAQFTTAAVASTLHALLSNTPPLSVTGGLVTSRAGSPQDMGSYHHFLIDGAFSESDVLLYSFVHEGFVVLELNVRVPTQGGPQ